MLVFANGTQIKVDGDIPATIRAIAIHSEHWVKYCCVWWDERARKEEWLIADEFIVCGPPTLEIQFHGDKN